MICKSLTNVYPNMPGIFIHMESLAFGNFKYNTLYSSRTVDASVYTNSQYEAHRFEDRLASRSAENTKRYNIEYQ